MKRIVFVHPDGLNQILGAVEVLEGQTLPVELPALSLFGRSIPFASLVKVKRGAAYYKEPMLPTSAQTFHEAQQ